MAKETTNWSEMTNHLANIWVETGTQMWKSWFDLVGSVPTSATVTEPKPEPKSTSEQQFNKNQELFVRFIKLSFDAWREISPKVEANEDWQQVLKKHTEQMRTQLNQVSAENLKASQDAGQLWQLYIKEMQKLSQLWTATLGVPINPIGNAVHGASKPWLELNNLYWNLLYEPVLGSLIQSPAISPGHEFTHKVLKAFDAWTNLYRGSINYQVVLADIQICSFEEVMQELAASAEKGKKVDDWQQFQQLWSRVADKVFEEKFCNEDNLKVRGNFLNALNTYRPYQQELMELWLKAMNLPVRSEVDEVHKNVYELRKESKRLNKKLASYEAIAQETQQLKSAVDESQKDVAELCQEIEALKQKLANYEAIEQETQQLRQEIESLRQIVVNSAATERKESFPFNFFNFNRNKI